MWHGQADNTLKTIKALVADFPCSTRVWSGSVWTAAACPLTRRLVQMNHPALVAAIGIGIGIGIIVVTLFN
ncbi:hypothetical protein ACWGBH_11060 [Streptomyces massasporeus]